MTELGSRLRSGSNVAPLPARGGCLEAIEHEACASLLPRRRERDRRVLEEVVDDSVARGRRQRSPAVARELADERRRNRGLRGLGRAQDDEGGEHDFEPEATLHDRMVGRGHARVIA